MPIVIIQLTDKKKSALDRHAAEAGTTVSDYMRRLIADDLQMTAADLLLQVDSHFGDQRLRIKPIKKRS